MPPKKHETNKETNKNKKKNQRMKKPLNPYFQYIKHRRPSLVSEGSCITVVEISKKIGREWSELSYEEKNKYNNLALEDLEKHNEKKIQIKNEKSKRKPTKYNLFMKSELHKIKSENTSLSHREAFSKAAANWSKAKHTVEIWKSNI